MTRYTLLKMRVDVCTRLASKAQDSYLATFYANSAKGYQEKLDKLTLAEANEVVTTILF